MLKIFRPCDFHVHLREGQVFKHVLKENNKNFQKILVMPNLVKPITNEKILSKYRAFVLKNNRKTEILFTIYLNQDCKITDLKNMIKNNLFFAAKLYPLHATTNSSSGVKDIKKIYVNRGPGSFAGIRNSLSIVKALNIANYIDYYCYSFEDFKGEKDFKYSNVPDLCDKFNIKKNLIKPIYIS